MRDDGRKFDELREIRIIPRASRYAEGSVLIEAGATRLFCTASVESPVPKWLQGSGQGWVTAEYGMLPRSTHDRIKRDRAAGSGRTHEISRLIGRSLRAAVDLKALGEKQIIVDCDVLQADGGTRTLAVSGGFVAMALALEELMVRGEIKSLPLKSAVAAVSVGIVRGKPLLDLCYEEDSQADTDMNIVTLFPSQRFAEIQGTAEGHPFTTEELHELIALGRKGCESIFEIQSSHLGGIFKTLRSKSG